MKKLVLLFGLLFSTNLLPFNLDIDSLKNGVKTSLQNIQAHGINLSSNQKTVLQVTGVLCGIYFGYKLFNKIYSSVKNNIEQHVEDKFLNLSKLQFKSNLKCTDSELRDKAWAINIRKVLIEKLNEVDSTDNRWSQEFKEALVKFTEGFALFDNIRESKPKNNGNLLSNIVNMVKAVYANPYEQEYQKTYSQLSYLDQKIVDAMVNNILLKYKPENECSAQEKIKKQELEKRSQKFNATLRADLTTMALNKALKVFVGGFFAFIF